MQIAIIGGTFDPPHIGHYQMILECANKFDKVLVVPNQTPSYKKENIATALQRYEMCKIMCENLEKVEVLDVEIAKTDFTYSVQTINELSNKYFEAELFLVLGTDNFVHFEKWYMFELILQMCTLCVFKRNDDELLKHYEYMKNTYDAKIELIENEVFDVSSTEIRGIIDETKMPQNVFEYINQNKIYGE